MLRIEFHPSVDKALAALPPKHARQVSGKIQALRLDPLPPDSLQLKGKTAEWRRATSGEYRIIYRVAGDTLKIAAAGHRNDDKVYRDFMRKL